MKRQLFRLVAAHVCLHACMAGTRMAAPLLALRWEDFGASWVLEPALFMEFDPASAERFADATLRRLQGGQGRRGS